MMTYSWFAGSLSYIEPAEDTPSVLSALSIEEAAQLLGCDKSVIIEEEI